jgi:pimeloyl-ACP methyl ester carboxylesterase
MTGVYLPLRPHVDEYLSLRGLRHHLLRWGQAVPGQPPLVMVHGWMDVGASFQFVVDALGPREVIALDWRGYGETEFTGHDAYWFPDYLGDLDALLDAVSPDAPVDLLGHSMGGNVVMSYAGVRPQRIRRLINLEGFGLPDAGPELAPKRLVQWLDELKEPAALRPYPTLQAVAERLMKNNPRVPADKAAWLAQHWSRPTAEGFELRADAAHKRVNPVLYKRAEALAIWQLIEAPVLWVEGAQTDMQKFWGKRYPREDFESRLAVVRQVERVLLEGAGHMLHHDQPEALAAAIERFLA